MSSCRVSLFFMRLSFFIEQLSSCFSATWKRGEADGREEGKLDRKQGNYQPAAAIESVDSLSIIVREIEVENGFMKPRKNEG